MRAGAEESGSKSEIRKITAKILLCCALLFWFGSSFLSEHYSRTRPTIENRAEGRVYRHGSYTYLTAQEHYSLMLLMIAAGTFFSIGVLVYPDPLRWRALR